jgi:lysophospholipase L1-like esterase
MKTILIYGDSNAWGETIDSKRLPRQQQWANILQEKLGRDYHVAQEGMPGRFAGRHSWDGEDYCDDGQHCFGAIFQSVSPVEIVILALGTNDTSDTAQASAEQIVDDILWYEKTVENMAKGNRMIQSKFIYVLIPNFVETRNNGAHHNDLAKRLSANDMLRQKVENFVEMNDVDLSPDGIHFSPKGHEQMAEAVFGKVKELGL